MTLADVPIGPAVGEGLAMGSSTEELLAPSTGDAVTGGSMLALEGAGVGDIGGCHGASTGAFTVGNGGVLAIAVGGTGCVGSVGKLYGAVDDAGLETTLGNTTCKVYIIGCTLLLWGRNHVNRILDLI